MNEAESHICRAPLVVYSSESVMRQPAQLLQAMFGDLLRSRELACRLALRDLKAMYRQSALGYFWVLIPPAVATAMFALLQSGGVFNVGNLSTPYPVFVLVGTVVWQVFSEAIAFPLRNVSANRALLTKINFPREALVLSGLLLTLFNLAVRVVVLLPVLVFFQVPLGATAWLFPLGLLTAAAFGMFLGLFLLPLGILYQDVDRLLGLALGFWVFLTPVLFPLAKEGFAATVMHWNPATPLVVVSREWLLGEPVTRLAAFTAIAVVSLVGVFLGWVLARVSLPHVTARLGM